MQNDIKEVKVRVGKTARTLKRTLKTGEYESLVIEIGFEEEIEWKTLSERQQKIDNWNTVLLQDFKESSDRILLELGLNHKKAYFKNPSEATMKKFANQVESAQTNEPNLDDLDTLG